MQTQHDLYWQMQKDSWLFHQKYFPDISESDEFWEKVVDESSAISQKYGSCKYIINLLLNEICEMERIYKQMKANEDSGFYDKYMARIVDIKTAEQRNSVLSDMQADFERMVRNEPDKRDKLSEAYQTLKQKCWEVV